MLDFAVSQMLPDNPAADALPAVLARLVSAFGARAALAFQPSATGLATILATHPPDTDGPGLLARIGQLPMPRPSASGATNGAIQLPVTIDDQPGSALIAYSAPAPGQRPCAVALLGEFTRWPNEVRSSVHAVAGLAATQIRTELISERDEQIAQLRELDEARNQFIAMVSHELRTPLTSIISFSELIKGEAQGMTPDGLRFLDIIERNAAQLFRLTGDLQLLSKLQADAFPLELAPVSIPELTAEAVRNASVAAANQDVTVEITTGTGPPVTGDSRRLLQALDNLISNAVKFSHRHSWVHVDATCHGQTWRIDVTDTGIGIPPEEAAQLFDRFVRGSNARTAGLPGTGLGLFIVKMIVELHGGHVEVKTVLDRGSTFSVFLPVTR